VLVSLKLIDHLFLQLPTVPSSASNAPCWERWNIGLFAEIFTRQGFEVESTTRRGEAFEKVVVGQIKSAEKHPKADKLQVCQVQTAAGDIRQIVCGAPNARVGLFVAVALPGAVLPNGLEIKASKIRDVESFGMLCSREELALTVDEARDGTGIWELHHEPSCGLPEAKLASLLGQSVFNALGLDDVLFELNVTPNRPDLLCHEGAARELFAGLKWAGQGHIPLKSWISEWKSPASAENILSDARERKFLETQAGRFNGQNDLGVPAFFVGLDNVKVSVTPGWMRNALEVLGQKSVNSVVDACNLILLCFAQPNHAFDLNKLNLNAKGDRSLTLRFAVEGEKFVGLDGKDRNLSASDCVVADGKIPQALLGVIGGDLSKVEAASESLVLEFANPHPVLVRRTSRRHGRKTDSSFAFEKGIDVFRRAESAEKLVGLLNALQPSQPLKYVGCIYATNEGQRPQEALRFFPVEMQGQEPSLNKNLREYTISFHENDMKVRVGDDLVSFEKRQEILQSLGFAISKTSNKDVVEVLVPSWRRLDVSGPADLVEEIVRVVGIDHVPAHPLSAPGQLTPDDAHLSLFELTAQRMVSLGYHETAGFHFMRADDWQKMKLAHVNSCGEPVALLNPIIKDEPLMQATLLSGLLRKVAHNLNYGNKRGQLFEISRTFQNYDVRGRRVFADNGENVGLGDSLKTPLTNELYEYSPKTSLALSREETASHRPGETPRICAVVFGNEEEKEWLNTGEREWQFHRLAAHVSEVLSVFGLSAQLLPLPADHPLQGALHPGRAASLVVSANGRANFVGWVAQFHPAALRAFEIDDACLGFELNLATAQQLQKDIKESSSGLQRFSLQSQSGVRLPSVERDFAFLVDESTLAQQLVDAILSSVESDALKAKNIPARILSAKIFDIYRGQGVPAGKKSVALRLTLLPTERTLVEADIQAVTEATVSRMEREFSAQLRG